MANDMIRWMKKTFGTTTNPDYKEFAGDDGGAFGNGFPVLFNNLQGIYGMIPNVNVGGFNASGHVDMVTLTSPTICDGNCFFNPDGGIKLISFWQLH